MSVGSEHTAIAILGMHRSGTSALAGTLRSHSVYFGDVLDQGIQHNPKGLQEAPSILYMQEDLLAKNGGAWHIPPAKVEWQPLHKAVRDLFIESRSDVPLWAFKDPRTLLTLEGWLDALPDLKAVGIFRHPAEVAMSIHTRNEFDLEKCVRIWCAYNERLLHFHRTLHVPIIEFVGEQAVMESSLSKVVNALNLQDNSPENSFYEPGMKRQDLPSVPLSAKALELYQSLQAAAL